MHRQGIATMVLRQFSYDIPASAYDGLKLKSEYLP